MPQRRLAKVLSLVVLAIIVTADTAESQKPKRSLLQRLQFWNKPPPPIEPEEKKIPEWSEFAKKNDAGSDFGVDDYSTGGTIDTEPLTEDDLRPPMPKDPPPKVPDEIDVTEGTESVRSDVTMDDESSTPEQAEVTDDKVDQEEEVFQDARQEEEEEEFHDAQQEEL